MYVPDERDFTGFEFMIRLGWITYIATALGLRMAWYYFITFGDIEILCVRNLAVATRENLTSIVVFTFPERAFINGTVECRYNAVQFIMILSSALQWQQQNINQTSNSQQTPHIPPTFTGELWGVYREDLGENWSRYNDTPFHLWNRFEILQRAR